MDYSDVIREKIVRGPLVSRLRGTDQFGHHAVVIHESITSTFESWPSKSAFTISQVYEEGANRDYQGITTASGMMLVAQVEEKLW